MFSVIRFKIHKDKYMIIRLKNERWIIVKLWFVEKKTHSVCTKNHIRVQNIIESLYMLSDGINIKTKI